MAAGSPLVQELIYDVIGRLIPGCITIGVCSISAGTDPGSIAEWLYSGSTALKQSTSMLAITFLILGYVVGHLITPIGGFVHSRVLPFLFPGNFEVLKQVVAGSGTPHPQSICEFYRTEIAEQYGNDISKVSASQYRQHIYRCHDLIRSTDPAVGFRIAKMRAQYRMLEGVYVAFGAGVLIQFGWWLLGWRAQNPWLPLASNTGCFIWSLLATASFFRAYQWAVINEYFLLKRKASASSMQDNSTQNNGAPSAAASTASSSSRRSR